eukprot:419748-Pelagomonas_calceolata.AAC.3
MPDLYVGGRQPKRSTSEHFPCSELVYVNTNTLVLSLPFVHCAQQIVKHKSRVETLGGRIRAATKAEDQEEIARLDGELAKANQGVGQRNIVRECACAFARVEASVCHERPPIG